MDQSISQSINQSINQLIPPITLTVFDLLVDGLKNIDMINLCDQSVKKSSSIDRSWNHTSELCVMKLTKALERLSMKGMFVFQKKSCNLDVLG